LMGCSWGNGAHCARRFTVNKNYGKYNRTRVLRELPNYLETADNPPINTTSKYCDLRNSLRRWWPQKCYQGQLRRSSQYSDTSLWAF
jgi:hypothetical protein